MFDLEIVRVFSMKKDHKIPIVHNIKTKEYFLNCLTNLAESFKLFISIWLDSTAIY